ncbi:sodium- and chloride-dependent betaine transporter-like [Argopecten irradians]|uniref:sodium- and chloride-dependent betaine transporter-like n=1 Tax=Argopecten irradians TaxID=31199 RepID=UPI003710532E
MSDNCDNDNGSSRDGNKRKEGMWKNKMEYIMSLAGYSTGASDFWRFPYMIWRHGGGTFILAYIISAAIISVPPYYLEVAVSQFSGRGMFDVWDIAPIMKGLGFGMFIINLEYLMMAPSFRLWIMEYIGYSFMSPLPWKSCDNPWNTFACVDSYSKQPGMNATMNVSLPDSSAYNATSGVQQVLAEEEFFLHKVLQISSGIHDFQTLRWDLVLCAVIFATVCCVCIIKSAESIGKVMYVFTFLPILLLIIVWIRTLIAPGSVAGMSYFLTPDITKLWDLELWVQAGFAAAYSLCIANGGIMEIGSRAPFRTSIFSASVIPCIMDVAGSIFTSMVIYSVIGVMAHESGMKLDDTLFSGNSAAFVAFSRAFSFFPLPNLWLVLFFVAFLVATSDIAIFYAEIFNRFLLKFVPCLQRRPKISCLVTFISMLFLLLPFCTQAGAYLFHFMGWYIASMGMFVMATTECIIFMWIYGGYKIDQNVRLMNGRPMPHLVRFAAAFICPVLYIVFLILGIVRYKPPVFGTYHFPSAAQGIGITISLLPVVPLLFWIVLSLYRNRDTGYTKKTLSKLFTPSALWGPSDTDRIDDYGECASKPISWSHTAYYNLTGRQRKITRETTNEQPYEMTKMV